MQAADEELAVADQHHAAALPGTGINRLLDGRRIVRMLVADRAVRMDVEAPGPKNVGRRGFRLRCGSLCGASLRLVGEHSHCGRKQHSANKKQSFGFHGRDWGFGDRD